MDVGGTFTDLVHFDGGHLRIFKLLSTRADPSQALLDGMAALDVAASAIISHGTTVATNAVLEHTGAATALITTVGFRDVLAIGRQTRPALYRLKFESRWLPVPDELRFEVPERVAPDGRALIPLNEAAVAAVLDQIVAAGAESLAVCLLFAFANPSHEQAVAHLARARGLNVSLSSEILPEFREFERTSTTVLNAYVSPLMARYLDALEAGLDAGSWILEAGVRELRSGDRSQAPDRFASEDAHSASGAPGVEALAGLSGQRVKPAEASIPESGETPSEPDMGSYAARSTQYAAGSTHPLWLMQSSGGILSAAAARREAVRTLLSGPAAGVAGAFHVSSLAGYDQVITLDMGGTSTDVSLADGCIRRTSEGSVEGWPVRVPMIDIHTVGAGGGSIAWADTAGALRVGPTSAGSEPGPACYGRGGAHFTVTDANLLLGRLAPAYFLAGRMMLDVGAAERAVAALAARLGLSPVALAEGVVRVVDAAMEQAIRVISVARGFDPRAFTLVPFGGAGPMHALALAEALHIGRVLIPRYPGVLSALGLTLADFTVDISRTAMRSLAGMAADDLRVAFAPLLAQGRDALAGEGFAESAIGLELALDLRYRGQSFELTVPLDDVDPAQAAVRFHAAHQQRYGYARPEAAVELVNLRVTGRGRRSKPELPAHPPAPTPEPALAQVAKTRLRAAAAWHVAPVYERGLLAPGHRLSGPALIVQEDATTVLLPGWRAEVDAWLNLVCYVMRAA